MKTEPPSVYTLASRYKAQGMDKCRAWDQYIIDMGLRPQIDAKEFYAIFAVADAHDDRNKLPDGWTATHRDIYYDRLCQVTVDDYGVRHIVWDNGCTGSNPPDVEADRFEKLEAQS